MNFGNDLWQFESAIVSDLGVKICLLIPGVTVEPEEGDLIKIGLEISNSETGGQFLKSDLWTLREVCTNGMKSKTEFSSVYFTKLGRMSYASKIRSFVKKLEYAKAAASEEANKLYEGITDIPILDTDLLALHRTLRRNVGRVLNADEVLGIEPEERIEIFNLIRDRDKSERPQATDFLAWDIHNAITATARESRLPIRQTLEQLGGHVLHIAQKRRREFSLN